MIYLVQENAVQILHIDGAMPEGKASLIECLQQGSGNEFRILSFTDEQFYKVTGAFDYATIDYKIVTNYPTSVSRYNAPLSEARSDRLISYSEFENLTSTLDENIKKFHDVLEKIENSDQKDFAGS